ncbi:methyltransferase [Aliiglaciecola litoralis]|uniref:Ribosomal RNA small subunit methyltransferase C n=1 Tax=Aliiglaciecola litoralis TaxID=582857 RepID=A0ABP3WY09_9ALTE
MLSAPSQVLLRNTEHFEQGKWLVVNPTEAEIFNQLGDAQFHGFHQYFDVYQACAGSFDPKQHTFGAHCEDQHAFDGAIIYMPKAKDQALMLIANMAAAVKPGGSIFLVGENKSGIKNAEKLCQNVSAQTNKIDSARHCALYCAHIEHDHSFELTDWLSYKDIQLGETSCSIAFLPGVFNAGQLDPGTKLLIENIKPDISGKVLDFACGAGVIACFVGKQFADVQLTLSDVSALAITCAKLSLEKNDLKGDVIASDGLAQIQGSFDHIMTNPPFHTGIKTDYSITQTFIQQVGEHMHRNSTLLVVANRFLPYSDLLKTAFGKVKTIAYTPKFNLYRC